MIAPDANAALVAALEDVLEACQRPHGPGRPVACLDETSKQLIKETPEHGGWLDMAEAEPRALSRQCLNRRIPDKPALAGEVAARQDSRNKKSAKADWQLATANARTKLKRLCPAM